MPTTALLKNRKAILISSCRILECVTEKDDCEVVCIGSQTAVTLTGYEGWCLQTDGSLLRGLQAIITEGPYQGKISFFPVKALRVQMQSTKKSISCSSK